MIAEIRQNQPPQATPSAGRLLGAGSPPTRWPSSSVPMASRWRSRHARHAGSDAPRPQHPRQGGSNSVRSRSAVPGYFGDWAKQRIARELGRLRADRRAGGSAEHVPQCSDRGGLPWVLPLYDLKPRDGQLVLIRPASDFKWQVSGGRWVDSEREYVYAKQRLDPLGSAVRVIEGAGRHDSMVLGPCPGDGGACAAIEAVETGASGRWRASPRRRSERDGRAGSGDGGAELPHRADDARGSRLRAARDAGIAGTINVVDNGSGDGSFEMPTAEVEAAGWDGMAGPGDRLGSQWRLWRRQQCREFGWSSPDARRPDLCLSSIPTPSRSGFRSPRWWTISRRIRRWGLRAVYSRARRRACITAFRFPSALGGTRGAAQFGPVSRLLARHVAAPPLPEATEDVDRLAGASVMMRRSGARRDRALWRDLLSSSGRPISPTRRGGRPGRRSICARARSPSRFGLDGADARGGSRTIPGSICARITSSRTSVICCQPSPPPRISRAG